MSAQMAGKFLWMSSGICHFWLWRNWAMLALKYLNRDSSTPNLSRITYPSQFEVQALSLELSQTSHRASYMRSIINWRMPEKIEEKYPWLFGKSLSLRNLALRILIENESFVNIFKEKFSKGFTAQVPPRYPQMNINSMLI